MFLAGCSIFCLSPYSWLCGFAPGSPSTWLGTNASFAGRDPSRSCHPGPTKRLVYEACKRLPAACSTAPPHTRRPRPATGTGGRGAGGRLADAGMSEVPAGRPTAAGPGRGCPQQRSSTREASEVLYGKSVRLAHGSVALERNEGAPRTPDGTASNGGFDPPGLVYGKAFGNDVSSHDGVGVAAWSLTNPAT